MARAQACFVVCLLIPTVSRPRRLEYLRWWQTAGTQYRCYGASFSLAHSGSHASGIYWML